MITLTYRQLTTTPILSTLQKMNQVSAFDGKTAYGIHKIGVKVSQQYQKSIQEFESLGEKFGQKAENGEFLKDATGRHIPHEDKKEEYAAELEKFLDTSFEIAQNKLRVDALNLRFSPQEIAALEPVIDGLEEVQTA